MNYLLVSLLISVVTVLVVPIIGAILSGDKIGDLFPPLIALTVVYFLVVWFGLWRWSIGFYGPAPFFWAITLGLFLGGFASDFDSSKSPGWLSDTLAILYIVYAVGGGIMSSDVIKAEKKAKLIGKVEVVKEIPSSLQLADPTHVCLVSCEMAENSMQAALSSFKVSEDVISGSRYEIGELKKQFVDNELWWIAPMEFRDYFTWKKDKQVPGYLRVSAENPTAIAQAVQYNKQGKEIHVKYLNSACFGNRAKRYLRYNGYATAILREFTFEVDDDWNPYYVVSVVERKTAFTGYDYLGVILFDLQSGKLQYITNEELSTDPRWRWIDRGAAFKVVKYQVGKWGLYANSNWWYYIMQGDKSQKPGGVWHFVRGNGENSDHSFFLTDMVSIPGSEDQSPALTGFMMTDSRSGKAYFYKMNGVTEDEARLAASALWADYPGVTVADAVPYNIDGQLTYVIPMVKNLQYAGTSLVSVKNQKICAMGLNFNQALVKYRIAVVNAEAVRTVPNEGDLETMEVTGKVASVGMPVMIDGQQCFFFTIEGINKSFQAAYSSANLTLPYLEPGNTVRIKYLDTKEPVIVCSELELSDMKFNDENPNQARYLENQKTAKEELKRVSNIQETGDIVESDEFKNVDPDELKKLIKKEDGKK